MDDKPKRETSGATGRKVRTDERGRTVWTEPVAAAELELVTTQELRNILKSTDEQSVRAIEDVAKSDDDGVLARNAETGVFQVVGETELLAILGRDEQSAPSQAPPAEQLESTAVEELSLVSTQALRKIIRAGDSEEAAEDEPEIGGGFDPYNTG